MKKYILGVAFLLAVLITPMAQVQAAGLSQTQIDAIIGLLQAFQADQSVIDSVSASLGGTPSSPGGAFCHNFNTDLTVGNSGDDVLALNHALSLTGFTPFADGPGDSVFHENTAGVVVHFQAKYGIPQTGYVGPLTRAKLNSLYGCANQSASATAVATPTFTTAPHFYQSSITPTGSTGFTWTAANATHCVVTHPDSNTIENYDSWGNSYDSGNGAFSGATYPYGLKSKVTCFNGIGTSGPSVTSDTVTLTVSSTVATTVPGAPTITSIVPLSQSATIIVSAPTGSSAITGYTATCTNGTSSVSRTNPLSSSAITVNGLTNGTLYSCTVRAYNSAGQGTVSNAMSVTPRSYCDSTSNWNGTSCVPKTSTVVPSAPSITSIYPESGKLTISFTVPSSTGDSQIIDYKVTCGSISATNGAMSSIGQVVINGLTNGTPYSCTVSARNSAGYGPSSAAVSATPSAATPTFTTQPSFSSTSISSTGSTMLNWAASGADHCSVTYSNGANSFNSAPVSYSLQFNGSSYPNGITLTATVTCTSLSAQSVARAATLTVTAAAPTASWNPTSATITSGGTIPSASFSSSGASYCNVYDSDGTTLLWGNAPTSWSQSNMGPFTAGFTHVLICYSSTGVASTPASYTLTVTNQGASAYDAYSSASNSAKNAEMLPPQGTGNTTTFHYVWNNNLQIGSSYTEAVKALQTALTHEGLYTGEVSGGFYNQTFSAVKAFQQKYGIDTGTNGAGFVGSKTRAKLNTLY